MRPQLRRKAAILTPAVTLLIASCGSSLDEYKRFAEAGKEYSKAMDSLLVTSGALFVDSNSEALINLDRQNPIGGRAEYSAAKENVIKYIKVISLARDHTRLLQNYFQALQELATSDAPQRSADAANRVFNQVVLVGQQLEPNIFSSPAIGPEARQAYSQIPSLILSAKIKGALRAELLARKEAIYKELITQELVQKLLAQQINANLQIINSYKEMRTIKPAYESDKPVAEPDKWIALRAQISQDSLSADALEDASKTSKALQEAFKDLLSNRLTVARAGVLVDDIRDLVTLIHRIESASRH
jgi:hypothetical protein